MLVALRIVASPALQDAVANQLAERFLHGESFVRSPSPSSFFGQLTADFRRQSFLDTFLVALNPRNVIPELYSKSIAHEHAGA